MSTVIVTDEQQQQSAEAQTPAPEPEREVPVTVYVVIEGMRTSDGRFIEPGSLTHRALPLPILGMDVNTESGHTGAEVFGRLDSLVRVPGPDLTNRQTGEAFPEGTFVWVGTGSVRADHPHTQDMRDRYLVGNSVDLTDCEYDVIMSEPDEPDGFAEVSEVRFTSGVIAGTTICPFPAFAESYVEIDGETLTPADVGLAASARPVSLPSVIVHEDDDGSDALVAAAEVAGLAPASWFVDPQLDRLTPLTVDESGRIYGHLAGWGIPHIGHDGTEVFAPRTRTNYAYFMLHDYPVRDTDDEGHEVRSSVAVGHLTLGGGHADVRLGRQATVDHYDEAGTRAARVCVGEDAFGVWVAGEVRPELPRARRRDLAESPISGDWRRVGGNLELVAVLAVNTPGFPIPRSRVASGQAVALVAAGALPRPSGAVVLDYDTLADAIAERLATRQRREVDEQQLAARQSSARLALRRSTALAGLR